MCKRQGVCKLRAFNIHIHNLFTFRILSHTARNTYFRTPCMKPPFYMMVTFPQARHLSPTALDTKAIQNNLTTTHTLYTMIIINPLRLLSIFVWISYLHAYLYITCVAGVHRCQKRVSDLLETVSHRPSSPGPLEEPSVLLTIEPPL